jgi:type IV pilus assembly protein PilA
MYRMLREHQSEGREDGFTLIELLVVVIIIGILAAIAIPVFLNQRERAWNSAAQSDVRNMATAQESYLTDNPAGGYADSVDPDLTDEGFNQSENVEVGVCTYDGGNAYVVAASHEQSDTTFYFDSSEGAIVDVEPDTTATCDTDPLS